MSRKATREPEVTGSAGISIPGVRRCELIGSSLFARGFCHPGEDCRKTSNFLCRVPGTRATVNCLAGHEGGPPADEDSLEREMPHSVAFVRLVIELVTSRSFGVEYGRLNGGAQHFPRLGAQRHGEKGEDQASRSGYVCTRGRDVL